MKNILKIIIPIGMAIIAIALAFVFIRFTPMQKNIKNYLDTAYKSFLEQDYEAAIAQFKKVLQFDPRNIDAYIGIAQAYEAIGDTESALEWLHKGYDLTGDSSLKAEIDRISGLAEEVVTAAAVTTISTDTDKDEYVTIETYQIPTNITTLELIGPDSPGDFYNTNSYILEMPLTDISFISKFTDLKYLKLIGCHISDISALSNLTNLKHLELGYNQISDISALSNLTNLEWLYLVSNQISDISVLRNLSNLNYLFLAGNQISDISILSNLTNLTDLNLGNNQISDISVLSNLTSLKWLLLFNNRITDINPLSNLTNLKELNLNYNQISDISSLSNLTNLKFLSLDDNQISQEDRNQLQETLPNCQISFEW